MSEGIPRLTLTPDEVTDLTSALTQYHAEYGHFFRRSEPRMWAYRYLLGLLSPLERKSVEPMVLAQVGASDAAVRGMQQFLNESPWDDTAVLEQHWHAVDAELGDPDGMLIVDGSDFPKKGQESVGVQRQYCGQLGKIANCQAGVFVGYASVHGTTLLDRRVYLPEPWVTDPAFAAQRRKCRVPADVTFQTKSELALAMLQAIVAQGRLRCRWVLADEAFGRDTAWLDAVAALSLWYMVEVPLSTQVWMPQTDAPQPISPLFDTTPATAWVEQTSGDGTKGRRIANVVIHRVQAVRGGARGPDVWLVLRIDPESGERKAFLSNAPAMVDELIVLQVTGMRWPMEHVFETAKQDLGMGDDEVRGWRGWHHHMTLVILAHFFLVRMHCRLKKKSRC
ncbi:MAG: IS701 family transposase [Blastochloris sp.]|nr:IS701 family transposase [Blastochloris sp.]